MRESHKQRLITAIVCLPLVAAAVYFGGWLLFAVLTLVALAGQAEFYAMFWPGKERLPYKIIGGILGLAIMVASFMNHPAIIPGIILLAFWIANLDFLREYGVAHNDEARFESSHIMLTGLCYLPLLLQFAIHLHPAELVLVLLAAFASDIGGYYAGCYMGKNKIWPRVSPKKTWEGSLGGMLFCIICTIGVGMNFGDASLSGWITLGILLNIASQTGDFFESALKRTLGVKDSGALLPGHGGILDRIDSILLVLAAYSFIHAIDPFFS